MKRYEEYPVPGALSPLIECAWVLTPESDAGGASLDRIFPDGACDIVVADGKAAAYGPASSWRFVSRSVPMHGFRIRRGAAKAVLGISPAELPAGPVPMEALWGRYGTTLESRLAAPRSRATSAESLAAILFERLDAGALDKAVLAAIDHIDETPNAKVEALASNVGLSARQLRRRFETSVGLGLKMYERIIRFGRLLHAARRHKDRAGAWSPDWARLACDHGFADQAHMIREVTDFAGLTPGELLRTLS